ncbi:hypothetical protein BJX76DRAFT_358622 [Aspergillus varians]
MACVNENNIPTPSDQIRFSFPTVIPKPPYQSIAQLHTIAQLQKMTQLKSKPSNIFSLNKKPGSNGWFSRLITRLRSDPAYVKEVEEHDEIESKLARYAVSDLSPRLVDDIFQLKCQEAPVCPWDLREEQMRPVPPLLNEVLERFALVTLRSYENEPHIRGRLNNILLLTLAEEIATSPTTVGERPSVEMMNAVFWSYETYLASECVINREKTIVHSYADYSLYYGNPDDMETNLIVVEAKKRGHASSGVAQVLGYMGIVQWLRKAKNKQKTSVFGLSTDSYCFMFCHIDETGHYSIRTVQFGLSASQDALVISYLTMILAEAAQLSPTATRVSNQFEELLSANREGGPITSKKRKSGRSLSAGIAHLNVGPQETPFDVHLEVLCDCSPYFDTIYKDRATSTIFTQDPVTLPDVDADVFATLLTWIYRGALPPDLVEPASGRLLFLFELWVLAARFEIPALQSEVMSFCEKIIENKPHGTISAAAVSYVYAHTDAGSRPRCFVLDTWVARATEKRYSTHREDLPRGFLEDLCGELIAQRCCQDQPSPSEAEKPAGISESRERAGEEWIFRWQNFEPARLATRGQMESRRLKIPCLPSRGSSPASAPGVTGLGSESGSGVVGGGGDGK